MSDLKVMIFESDRGFADALQRAFVRRGCAVRVVDDGQIGLDVAPTDPPDLIIVAVELPRMSGFAVCNKLKKVNELKDIPVVITSSESSQETFDHHSKLRTRAEDYVHKPISPEELIRRCAAHVQVPDAPPGDSEEITIDDLEAVALSDDAVIDAPGPVDARDAELDNIADAAFDQIMLPSSAPGQVAPAPVKVPAQAPERATPAPALARHALVDDDLDDLTMVGHSRSLADMQLAMRSFGSSRPSAPSVAPSHAPPAAARSHTPAPFAPSAPVAVKPEEHERLRARVDELEGELAASRATARKAEELTEENARLRHLADESQRLSKELDEVRSRATRAAPPGAREGLELRESLHKKDKEILHLRELANGRDKELLQLRETLLQRDLEKADLDERLLEREREVADLTDRGAATAQDLEALKASHDEVRGELTALRAAREELDRALADARKQALDAEGSLRAELAAEREGRARAVAEAASARSAAEAQHAEALDAAKAALAAETVALAGVTAALAAERSARADEVKSLADAHAKALAAQGDEHAKTLAARDEAHAKALAAQGEAHAKTLAAQGEAHAKALAAQGEEHAKALAALDAAHEQKLASAAEAQAAAIAALGAELTAEKGARADEATRASEVHAAAIATLRAEHETTLGALSTARDQAASRADRLERDLADAREDAARARRVTARNAALLERARRAMLIAAGLVDETTTSLDDSIGEAPVAGNAE